MVLDGVYPVTGREGPMPESDDDLARLDADVRALRALVPRVLTRGSSRIPDLQLLVRQLPPDLRFDLPLPPGSTILGSIVVGEYSMVYLDSDTAPDNILSFYRERFHAMGWNLTERLEPMRSPTGFTSAPSDHQELRAGHGDSGPEVTVLVVGPDAGPTDLQLTISPRRSPDRPSTERGPRLHSGLPPLVAPRGSSYYPQGGGGGPESIYSAAHVETELDLESLTASYEHQLGQSGWIRRDSGHSGPLTWSRWSVSTEDEAERTGIFFAWRQGEGNRPRYFLYVHLDWHVA
ncbi:MAG: hypothetical protein PVSMB7_04850 [Chloroflexota bacterium]